MAAPEPEAALLALTVVDPAVGSGHFVVAAGRRIAAALATVRTQDAEPGPNEMRAAIADVVERCLYGVDLNDLAIEITKVALWLEAFDATRPFPFLDAHFKVGNALLGVTPALLRQNIPDTAFVVLGDGHADGDDSEWTKKLRARNKSERTFQHQLHLGFGDLNVETAKFTEAAHIADAGRAGSLAAVRRRADSWRALEADPDLLGAKLVADTWCAAHVQRKSADHGQGITHGVLSELAADPSTVAPRLLSDIKSLARQYRFFHWHLEFPGIFTADESTVAGMGPGWSGGFSCVVGNPPWERVKVQDKEFFANVGRSDIVDAKTAALRTRMIASLATDDPPLHSAYLAALRQSEGAAHLLLRSGRYPLTGQGDVNTYSVFAETMRSITGPTGSAGIITPTGLATDKTTAPFFADTLSAGRLLAFYDFENEGKIFAGVHNQFRFAVTAMGGAVRTAQRTRFAFFTRYLADVPSRRFALTPTEVLTMNPNSGTLPMFRTRADADITLGIYERHPVLIRDGATDGNPWDLSFGTLFHMANDSGLFNQPDDLVDATFNGWSYERDDIELVPLYESKLLSHYDHRFSTYRHATQAQLNKGTLPRLSEAEHDDPDIEPLARYWVKRAGVTRALGKKWDRDWFLGWRDITNTWNERTFVPSVLPFSAVGHVFPLAFPGEPGDGVVLHALWSTMVWDYVARQKLSGTHMTYGIVKQLACPTPSTLKSASAWMPGLSLGVWVLPYVLELSYTSWRLRPYALEMGDSGAPFHWITDRRAELRADLEAAFLHVYGLTRLQTEHVLDSFFVVRKYEERDLGEYRTRRLVLEAYDRMAAAIARGGQGWTPLADVPAGQGPRHSARDD
ncbi:Eco57I restriction-modification methylase domain-containing protein [Modestobacter caceresii]|uniref:Eco57I restriction-modification methylase domain-containing protein n=1 Tax=Modestobacter caceresii TaxID=1522368 RepID=UPI00068D7B9F|nr:DNA methyltransferase [Modestobacter caceresii]